MAFDSHHETDRLREELKKFLFEQDHVSAVSDDILLRRFWELYDFYEFSPVGFLMLDRDALIRAANLRSAALFGVPRADFLGQSLYRFILHDDRDILYQHLRTLFKVQKPLSCELRVETDRHERRWMRLESIHDEDWKGEPASRTSVLVIDDQKRVEQALRQARAELEDKVAERTAQLAAGVERLQEEIEERRKIQVKLQQLSRVFMDATDPIIIEDLSGKVIEMNHEAEDAYGWKRSELIGQSVRTLFPPEHYERSEKLRAACLQGAEIRNWEGVRQDRYGKRILVLLTAFPLLDSSDSATGLATIAKDITMRKQMESRLKASETRLKALSRRSIEALEADRRAVSRELHDSIGGSLAAIKYLLEETAEQIQDACPSAAQSLEKSVSYLSETIKESKRISVNLRPLALDDLGLVITIEGYIRQFCGQYRHIQVLPEVGVREEDVPDEYKIVIYRVLQEALANVARHSKADRVAVRLKGNGSSLELEVEDNGCGFDAHDSQKRHDPIGGYGLKSMRERAEICGGSLIIRSRPTKGTSIHMSLPTR
jgi:PAS domain S-box-containing protein